MRAERHGKGGQTLVFSLCLTEIYFSHRALPQRRRGVKPGRTSMNFIRVMHDRIYINCRRRVLIYLTAALCAAVFAASPSAALTRSEDGFYLIATAAELAEFRDMVNEGNDDISARLTADIDLSKNGELSEWKPIGNPSFNGTFDGGGHTVSGYVVREAVYDENLKVHYAGFFARIGEIGKNASILNMVLYGDATVFINGTLRIGGLSGYLHGDWNGRSKITNCVFIGNIKGDANNNKVYAGGTIGYNNGGKIVNCFCSGNVIALGNNESFSGGMIGHNQKQDPQMIVNCCWEKGNPTTIESGYAERGIGNHESNVVLFEKLTNLPVIVTTLAAVTKNSSIAIGANQSATISLVTKPDTPQNLSDYIVNPNVVANSYNGDIIEVINNNDLTFTVKPLSVGETPVTFSATLYPTNFSNAANTEDDSLKQQLETTVNIKVTEAQTTPPDSGNGGGCSAGFGVPAFAALAVLILLRKRI